MTFDYAHQVMYLKSIVPPPIDAGTFDKSGMWINLGDNGLEVVDVAERSPANKAGLVVGDVIVAIDEKAVGSFSLSDARQQFRMRPDGTVIRLDIVRAGKPSTVKLELRSQL